MSKPSIIVLSVVHQGLSKKQVAAKYSVSIRWVNMLLARYRTGGLDAVQPKSKRPHSAPNRIPEELCQLVLDVRFDLTERGLDNGPRSIHWQLTQEGVTPPSIASIWRILSRAGAIKPQPRKRPRASYIRFEAAQPNETWQSDFTHWKLANDTDIEILNWLDDHSRFLLSCTAHKPVTSQIVKQSFLAAIKHHGPPQSTLTDNGLVYTAKFIGGNAPFEYTLRELGVQQKNGSPGHPQTQGKIERFHQTLKRYLAQQPKAKTIKELQSQLDKFTIAYNQNRPHSSLKQRTPAQVYYATIKAKPTNALESYYRVRHDKTDDTGKVTLRRAGILHKLGTGRANARTVVQMLIDEQIVTVISKHTGEVLSQHKIDPDRKYWPKITNPQL
jgi:transposase InsO family protein